MDKPIIIVNGRPRAGKDTFAKFLNEIVPVRKYSMVSEVKRIATIAGWDGMSKEEKDRKFLSDLKVLLEEYNNFPLMDVCHEIEEFKSSDYKIMLIDAREEKDIIALKTMFKNVYSLFIDNRNVPMVLSNKADRQVEDICYDFRIENNGTLEEFHSEVIAWWAYFNRNRAE